MSALKICNIESNRAFLSTDEYSDRESKVNKATEQIEF